MAQVYPRHEAGTRKAAGDLLTCRSSEASGLPAPRDHRPSRLIGKPQAGCLTTAALLNSAPKMLTALGEIKPDVECLGNYGRILRA